MDQHWIYKKHLKKGHNVWTQRDEQATKEALNTFMVQIFNKTGYSRQKQAPIAPMAIRLGIAGGLAATNWLPHWPQEMPHSAGLEI